jgi:hypothetical protein
MKLKPKNWEKFQHYKDRSPPWIKLHRELLIDRDFMMLPIASKALAPLLWLLASESKDGAFDAGEEELIFRLHVTAKDLQGLKPLIDKGFFIVASGVLAECKQVASPEREGEREGEAERDIRASRKTSLPKDFLITERVKQWALEKGHHSLPTHFENFVSAAKAKGYTYVDWDEALMKAIRDNWAKVPAKQQRQVAM